MTLRSIGAGRIYSASIPLPDKAFIPESRLSQRCFVFAWMLLVLGMLALASRVEGGAATLITLHNFMSGAEGAFPVGKLVQGSDGNFYGVTGGGGAHNIGTVFSMTPTGAVTTLYSFPGDANGSFPKGGLLRGSDGNFYGTTSQGLTAAIIGTVFKITSSGTLTTLYVFPGVNSGATPYGALVEGNDNKLYGTTFGGGNAGGYGTVFQMDRGGGAPTYLHQFSGGADGGSLPAGLAKGNDGNFYGITYGGGSAMGTDGYGTVFRITSDGTFATLHTFTGGADGQHPYGGLVLGSDGDFYGTTELGDNSGSATGGTIFKITSTGTFTTLHAMTGLEGSDTTDALMQGTDGNFYGTTTNGGASNGTLFQVTPTGTFTLLHTFQGGADGRQPQAGLVQGTDGSIYGSTTFGGDATADAGRVFHFGGAAATPATLGNISTRLQVGTGDNALIGGFIIAGTQPKKVIVRAIGPSLPFAGVLADPFLELHDSSGALIASNDNWRSDQEQEIIASTIPPSNELESAIVETLAANNAAYTAIVRGANDGIGVGLVEAYDLDQTVDSKLANISTRGLVQTGNDVMIAGTIVLGQATQRVLIRALGPSLSVAGKLMDPTLELRDGNGVVLAANDNWRSDQEQEIIATTIPPTDDMESAIVATLSSNRAAYTAIVRGVNDASGIAVVEIYALN